MGLKNLRGFLNEKGTHMILNPGTQHFDFTGVHTPIITMALEPSASGSPTDLNNNPDADTSG